MKIGYIRVSTTSQNTARQEVLMQELTVDKIYIDKISGKNTKRPALQEMKNFIESYNTIQEALPEEKREQLTVITESISRFARNTKDLLELVDFLNEHNAKFISKKEAIDTNTPSGVFMLTVFGALAQLEREYILDRQKEGIAIAKEMGKYKGRQKIEVGKDFKRIYDRWKSGDITARRAMELLDVKPNTFYRRVKEFEEGRK